MHAVRCPKCGRWLVVDEAFRRAKVQCRNCEVVFIGSTEWMDDPDAPTPQPWVHWVICKIPATATGLPEGVAKDATLTAPEGALQGVNSWGSDNIGYRGPAPPPGHGVHHYYFKLYALDTKLNVQPRLTKTQLLSASQENRIPGV